MNVEQTICQLSSKLISHKKCCAKGAVLSFSLFLGACASTGDNVNTVSEPLSAEPVKENVQVKKKASPQTPAQLMKSLKAPLVASPEADVISEKTPPDLVNQPVSNATDNTEESASVEAPIDTAKQVVEATLPAQDIIATAEAISQTEPTQTLTTEPTDSVQKEVQGKQDSTENLIENVSEETDAVKVLSAKPFNVSANKLPFNYDIWTIKQGNTSLAPGLVISTPTWEMGKEGYMSQIWLTLMEDSIHINSSSDIETASKGLGIRIDGGALIEFSSIAENNIGVISGKWLNKLAAANKIDIYLGFFPGKKPTSETFSSDLSLKNLARIVATYRMLNQ